jgi:hypothetical protein
MELVDDAVSGLRLRIATSGAKTFILRKRVAGRMANITLGRFHDTRFGVTAARKKARVLLNDIEGGGDPRTQTRRSVGAIAGTVRALFPQYKLEKGASGLSARSRGSSSATFSLL